MVLFMVQPCALGIACRITYTNSLDFHYYYKETGQWLLSGNGLAIHNHGYLWLW